MLMVDFFLPFWWNQQYQFVSILAFYPLAASDGNVIVAKISCGQFTLQCFETLVFKDFSGSYHVEHSSVLVFYLPFCRSSNGVDHGECVHLQYVRRVWAIESIHCCNMSPVRN